MPQKLQIWAILEIHKILLPQKFLAFNILFKPKEREKIKLWQGWIDKIMAGMQEAINDWSDKVNMHLIKSYSQYLDIIQ